MPGRRRPSWFNGLLTHGYLAALSKMVDDLTIGELIYCIHYKIERNVDPGRCASSKIQHPRLLRVGHMRQEGKVLKTSGR